MTDARQQANEEAVERLCSARPFLTGVATAIDVVPGMQERMILTSGAPLPWESYTGGQREGIIGAAIYEGLAGDQAEAEERDDRNDRDDLREGLLMLSVEEHGATLHDPIAGLGGVGHDGR